MKYSNINNIYILGDWGLGIGDWGLGIGDWGLGGQDELNPFYLYIIIQAQIQKLSSNLKYIQYYIPKNEFETPMFATIQTILMELERFSFESLPYAKNFELDENTFEKYCNYAANGKQVILKKKNI